MRTERLARLQAAMGTHGFEACLLFSEPNVTFKPDDIQLIARSQVDPYGLVVHTSTPFKTIDAFVEFARRKPEFVNVGGPFAMSGHRVAWELFSELAKIKTTWVPYPGGGPALTAIAGGHVDAAAGQQRILLGDHLARPQQRRPLGT